MIVRVSFFLGFDKIYEHFLFLFQMLLFFDFIVDVGPISEDAFRVFKLFIVVMNCTYEMWVLGIHICLYMRIVYS